MSTDGVMRGEELASCDTFLKFAEMSSLVWLVTVVLNVGFFHEVHECLGKQLFTGILSIVKRNINGITQFFTEMTVHGIYNKASKYMRIHSTFYKIKVHH